MCGSRVANNELSEVFDNIKPGRRVKIIGYRQSGSKMSKTSDDSLFAQGCSLPFNLLTVRYHRTAL